ncbi:MAG: acetylglutamate kinase [Actinomycetes bacterium]|jgi:acetylglutamate kinase|nr:acetylglutamate kinase [Actinomycetes bacterium]
MQLEQAGTRARCAIEMKKAEVFMEALPWIKEFAGRTVVIKYGGAAMTDAAIRDSVLSDIVMLKMLGLRLVMVHGGGKEISNLSERLGLPVEFQNGLRITSPEVMDVVKMTLIGKVNQELVAQLNAHGNIAVGLNGADGHTLAARCSDPALGRVGAVAGVDAGLIGDLLERDYMPVIATVAVGDDGDSYNVNADEAAAAIAVALGAHRLILLTDVDGLYGDFADKSTLISRLSQAEAAELLQDPGLSRGMRPKVAACVAALRGSVAGAHILNGTIPHSLLLEMFTDEGVGTMFDRGIL